MVRLPSDLEAESCVLGSMLLDNRVCDEVRSALSSDDFFGAAHAKIFDAVIAMVDAGKAADEVTVAGELRARGSFDKAGGWEALNLLVERVPSTANLASYVAVVREKSRARALVAFGQRVVEQAETDPSADVVQSASQELYDLADTGRGRSVCSGREASIDAMRFIADQQKNKAPVTGIPSGLSDLDATLCGFQPQDLIIIAARPSMGKTMLALNAVGHMTTIAKKHVALFELEMSTRQLTLRMISALGRVDAARIKRGQFGDADYVRVDRAVNDLTNAGLVIDDSPMTTLVDVRLLCRKLKSQGRLDAVVIDYLQLMHASKERDSREREVSEISRGLKGLAKELNVPVIALSQLNRGVESRSDKRPLLSDLRESGAIEQDADVIIFLYRDEVYNPDTQDKGKAELLIAKHRNGPIGRVVVRFDGSTQRFDDLAGQR